MPNPYDAPMRAALEIARAALDGGDVPVGAVVLGTSGTVIGTGHNVREVAADPTGHAEVIALRESTATRGQ